LKLVLAPIADYTDPPFRLMCFANGADAAFTEMVSAAALRHSHRATRRLLEKDAREGRVSCQIFGSDELDVAVAAKEIESLGRRFEAIDLNAGCPMARITRTGAGAALLSDPGRIYRLLKAIGENTSLPVTLKTRIGPRPGSISVFEIVDAAERAGAAAVAVHARYASQMHGGVVHLDVLAEAVGKSKLPITGNGSVVDAKSAAEMAATGVSSIMIARAAMSNPCIFAEIGAAFEGRPPPPRPGASELFSRHLKFILEYRDMLSAKFPSDRIPDADSFAVMKMRTHLFRYFNGMPGAAAMRGRLPYMRSIREMIDGVKSIDSKFNAEFMV